MGITFRLCCKRIGGNSSCGSVVNHSRKSAWGSSALSSFSRNGSQATTRCRFFKHSQSPAWSPRRRQDKSEGVAVHVVSCAKFQVGPQGWIVRQSGCRWWGWMEHSLGDKGHAVLWHVRRGMCIQMVAVGSCVASCGIGSGAMGAVHTRCEVVCKVSAWLSSKLQQQNGRVESVHARICRSATV